MPHAPTAAQVGFECRRNFKRAKSHLHDGLSRKYDPNGLYGILKIMLKTTLNSVALASSRQRLRLAEADAGWNPPNKSSRLIWKTIVGAGMPRPIAGNSAWILP